MFRVVSNSIEPMFKELEKIYNSALLLELEELLTREDLEKLRFGTVLFYRIAICNDKNYKVAVLCLKQVAETILGIDGKKLILKSE